MSLVLRTGSARLEATFDRIASEVICGLPQPSPKQRARGAKMNSTERLEVPPCAPIRAGHAGLSYNKIPTLEAQLESYHL